MPDMSDSDDTPERTGAFAALLGWVLGTALQLQQGALWPVWVYGLLAVAALALAAGLRLQPRLRARPTALQRVRRWPARHAATAWLLALAVLAFACTGLRSLAFESHALEPVLEGRDLRVVGVVTGLPQRNESGLRFTLATESATLDARATAVPARLDVGWYSAPSAPGGEPWAQQGQAGEVRAGERWSMTLRPKAPHGSRNPFGFDYELWLWERGVQATAYVRTSARDAPPQRLEQTWLHPVALLRQGLRERIFASVPERQLAGLIAALVVGDQAAIERWRLTNKS